MGSLLIRRMAAPDLEQAMFLKEAANWNQTREDWKMLSDLPGQHLIAEKEGRIVGTIAALDYGDFVWIAMVLVHPDNRRQGIASQLMQEVLDLFPDRILRLDATADGSKVYENFDFREEYRLSRWRLNLSPGSNLHHTGNTPPKENDFSEIVRSDVDVFGGNRAPLLSGLRTIEQPIIHADRESGEISYLFFRPGIHAWHIGPVVASNIEIALAMLRKCLSLVADRPFFIDIPEREDWTRAIGQLGFNKQRVFIRMQLGGWEKTGSTHEFAIAGPEFG